MSDDNQKVENSNSPSEGEEPSKRSSVSILIAQEKAKEQRRLMLWKSRVNLVKRARSLLAEKAFSDAAVAYEKYLRVLETVYDVKPGELTPEHFKESARTQELTVVATAYWDLLRIYDTSPAYGTRMSQAAVKLAQFLRFTPLYPDVMRKAEAFSKTAKNPAVIKSFLKQSSETKGRCFVATSAFQSPWAREVIDLQNWRDEVLLNKPWGAWAVRVYYRYSPGIAAYLDKHPWIRSQVRLILKRAVLPAVRHWH